MKLIIDINNNTQFRRILDKLNDETDVNERLSLDCLVYVKITKWVHAELIPEEIPGDHTKDWSQFYTVEGTKYPNMRYVAIGRTKKAYRNDKVLTGGYVKLEPWLFWRWVDYIGVENVLIEIPQAIEEVDEKIK